MADACMDAAILPWTCNQSSLWVFPVKAKVGQINMVAAVYCCDQKN